MLKTILLFFLLLMFTLGTFHPTNAQVIHETKSGDSLKKIAKQYNYNIETVAELNGLKKDTHLVLGQAVLIPGSSYVVQRGDSIAKIAYRHAITPELLMRNNHLTGSLIIPGQKLSIPRFPKTNIWTGTYYVPRDEGTNSWMLDKYKKTLSGLFVFEYHPNEKGELLEVNEHGANKLAWKRNLSPYATITNMSKKGYDPDLIHSVLSNSFQRNTFINNIYSLLNSRDYKGAVIDFELVRPEDRDLLNQFIKQLSERLHRTNMEVLMALPPKTGDKYPYNYNAYDYQTLGKYLDKLFLMTYNWHWPGGPSGPIAPLSEIRPVLNYAVTVVPKSKLMLGIPQYAYDWKFIGAEQIGTSYSTQVAINRYIKYKSQIYYDEGAAAPMFRYVDSKNIVHEVWFEDPRSLLAKFRLVKEYGLGGLGCWHLGTSMPQTEEIILTEFNVY